MRRMGLLCVVALCVACRGGSLTPPGPSPAAGSGSTGDIADVPLAWIYHPEDLNGSRGPDDDSCTFKFAMGGDENFHSEAICWERQAGRHKGTAEAGEIYQLYRQQFRKVHFESLPDCPDDGPGDLEGIRACVSPVTQGVETPCSTTRKTGMNGCVACDVIATCH